MTATATMLWAGLHGLLLVALSIPVAFARRRARVSLGDGGDSALVRAIRVQGNFVEYVPLALLLVWMVEAGGYPAWVVHLLGGALFVGRLAHAEGLARHVGASPGRVVGMMLTWGVLLAAGVLAVAAATV